MSCSPSGQVGKHLHGRCLPAALRAPKTSSFSATKDVKSPQSLVSSCCGAAIALGNDYIVGWEIFVSCLTLLSEIVGGAVTRELQGWEGNCGKLIRV